MSSVLSYIPGSSMVGSLLFGPQVCACVALVIPDHRSRKVVMCWSVADDTQLALTASMETIVRVKGEGRRLGAVAPVCARADPSE